MCSRNPLVTLGVSDCSCCGAVQFGCRSRNHLVTLGVSDCSRCGAVRIFMSLAQPSWYFVRVGSLSLSRSADFSIFSEILWQRDLMSSVEGPSMTMLQFFGRSFYDDVARVSRCSLRGR